MLVCRRWQGPVASAMQRDISRSPSVYSDLQWGSLLSPRCPFVAVMRAKTAALINSGRLSDRSITKRTTDLPSGVFLDSDPPNVKFGSSNGAAALIGVPTSRTLVAAQWMFACV